MAFGCSQNKIQTLIVGHKAQDDLVPVYLSKFASYHLLSCSLHSGHSILSVLEMHQALFYLQIFALAVSSTCSTFLEALQMSANSPLL